MAEDSKEQDMDKAADKLDSAPKEAEQSAVEASDVLPPGKNQTNLGNDITIFTDQRLPEYDNGEIKAYRGSGKGNIPDNIIAYVCRDDLSPRTNIGANYNKIINPNLMRLVASGVVYWPEDKRHRYVLVYDSNLGKAIADDDHGAYGWDQDQVSNSVITPMIGLLLDFRDKEFVHGRICPTNIFDGASAKMERVVLGECLSQPAWNSLPSMYLTIEKAMTDPFGRGRGVHEEDLYSFGVMLTVLMRNTNPLKGLSEKEIIAEKIKHGSYQTLTGKDRFTGSILELLRGLLVDDVNQRWTLDEIQAWMDGRRLSPKQSAKRLKANRPLQLMGQKYIYPELLAMDMPEHVNEAAHLVTTDELDQWLQRAIDNNTLTDRVNKFRAGASDVKGLNFQQMLVTHVCMALHPEAPIRYKKVGFLPEGIGTALTNAYVKKENVQSYVDLLTHYIGPKWVDNNEGANIDVGGLISKFESCKTFLKMPTIGFGVERCIYYLDPCAPCFSEKIRNYCVRNPEDLMDAFEHLSQKSERPHRFFDRHIVAFLSIKDRQNIDPYFYELGNSEVHQNVLGELKTLATIQKRSHLGNFPGIAEWIADNLSEVYERIHDHEKSKKLKKKVNKLIGKGDITKIAALFDDPHLFSNDKGFFFEAMKQFQLLKFEQVQLKNELDHNKAYGEESGRQIAAMVSCVIASIAILVSSFLAVSNVLGG